MAGSSSPKQTSTLTAMQRKVARTVGQQVVTGLNQPTPSYTGQKVAGLTPAYQQASDLLSTFNPTEFQGEQHQAVLRALSGSPSFDLSPATTDRFFKDTVMTPLLRSYQQNILPQINAAYASPGGGGLFSSRKGLAAERSLSDLQTSAASTLAQAQFSNQGLAAQLSDSAANRQLSGLGAANAFNLQPLSNASSLFSAGQPLQAQAQAGSSYDEFLRTLPSNNPYFTQALGLIGSNQTALYNPQGTNWGAIGSAAGALGGIVAAPFTGGTSLAVTAALGAGLGGTVGNLFTQGGGTGGTPLSSTLLGLQAQQQSQTQQQFNNDLVTRLLSGR